VKNHENKWQRNFILNMCHPQISVLPGGIASVRMKESEAPENRLKPGQTIIRIVFEVLCFTLATNIKLF